MKKLIYFLTMSGLLAVSAETASAQFVDSSADDGSDGTLRQEIMDTPAGGEITFAESVTNINLLNELTIDKELTISGPDGMMVTLDADGNGRIFSISDGPVSLNNLNLINGLAENGGAIYIAGADLTINNSELSQNVANGASGSGGAIFNDVGATLTVNNSSLIANLANRAGGAIEDNSGAGLGITLNDVVMTDNNAGVSPATAAPGNGGAVHITGAGDIEINGGSASGNIAAKEGGAFWNGSGTMTISGVAISGNSAVGNATGGGGLFNNGGIMVVDATTTLTGNIAMGATPGGRGGAIFNNTGGMLDLAEGLTISGNYASRAGGAIEDASGNTLTLVDVNFMGNATGVDIGLGNEIMPNPGNGGAIHLSGTDADITGGMANGNLAAAEGGAYWNNTGSMTVDGTSFDGNIATGADPDQGGGALYNNGGTLMVMNIAANGNIADGASGSGGAILNAGGSLTVSGSSFSGNSAQRAGGAIEDASVEGGVLTLTDNDFSENSVAMSPGNGGAVHVGGPGDSNISGGTANGNTAGAEGGAFWNNVGTMSVDGTSFDGNTASGNDPDNGGAALFNNGGTMMVMNITADNNVADGTAGSGGAILNAGGSLTVSGSSFSGNSAQRAGGAIEDASVEGGILTLTDNDFSENSVAMSPGNGGAVHVGGPGDSNISGGTANGNTAGAEGGAFWNNVGIMTVDGTFFEGNAASGAEADQGGGALFNNGGTMEVTNVTVLNNEANGTSGSGGGILNDGGSLTVSDSQFNGNSSNRAGGAIEEASEAGTILVISDVDFMNNSTATSPGNGGAVHITGPGDVSISGGMASGNTAGSEGGAFWNSVGTMTIDGVTIMGNTASGAAADNGGGGVFNNGGTMVITNSTVESNIADGASGSGGGLLSTAGNVTVNLSSFSANAANRAGGAIELIDGNLDFSTSSMMNNDVNGTAGTPAPGNGGGFHVSGMNGSILIAQSTVSGNAAGREGGGLWNQSGTMMNVTNSTISGNSAFGPAADDGGAGIFNNGGILSVMLSTVSGNTAASSGGGILTTEGGATTVNASTIAQNTAGVDGGGIFSVGSTSIKNTIVALNTAASGMDVSGDVSSDGFNLIGEDDQNAFAEAATDIEGLNPSLGQLQNNGGQTQTHALLAGSAGIDAGDPADNFGDQRNYSLVGTRDIGAFEFGGTQNGGVVCNDYVYFLADHQSPEDISDLYKVTIINGVAELTYLSTIDVEVHIAYNDVNNMVYAISKDDGSIYMLDPNAANPEYSAAVATTELTQVTQAVMSPDGKLLASSSNQDITYSIDVMNGYNVTVYDSYSPVEGGDLAYSADGTALYMATREGGGGLYSVFPADVMADQLLSTLPMVVTGMSTLQSGDLLISSKNASSMIVMNTAGQSVGTFPIMLNGEVFTLRDGDMTSGCNTFSDPNVEECDSYTTFYVNHGPDVDGSELYTVAYVDGTAMLSLVTNVDFEAHIAYNSNDELLYFVNKDGSMIRVYNVSSDTFEGDLMIDGDVDELTAVEYNPADEMLYVGDANSDVISKIDLNTGLATYFANAPVFGGDLSLLNGVFYLASRQASELYQIVPFGDAILLGNIPEEVNGMAPAPSPGNFVTSNAAQNAFVEISATDGSTVTTWPAILDGMPFTFINGDMAAGCAELAPADETPFVQAEAAQSQLTSYPNPTTGQSQVVFTTASTTLAQVEIYDLNGRNVVTLYSEVAKAGVEYRIDFNGTSLPNGVYVYRLTTQNETVISKFMIAR